MPRGRRARRPKPLRSLKGLRRANRLLRLLMRILEDLIVTLKLPPGSLWSEEALSERIGIGRTPVREAVKRL